MLPEGNWSWGPCGRVPGDAGLSIFCLWPRSRCREEDGQKLLCIAPPQGLVCSEPTRDPVPGGRWGASATSLPGQVPRPRFIRAPGPRKPLKEGLFAAHFPPCTRDRRFPGATHLLTAGGGLGSLFCHLPVSPIWAWGPWLQWHSCPGDARLLSLQHRVLPAAPSLRVPAARVRSFKLLLFPLIFCDFYQQLKVYQVHKEEGQVFFSFYNLSSSFTYFEVMVSGA